MAIALHRFRPRLLDALKGYNGVLLARDVGAGLTVGVVALPLAMAFAIASGVKPEAGIFTAIIAGLLISALGGSNVQIGGPAGAFIVIVYGIVERYGLANLLISTVLAGGLLFAMGLFKLGALVRYVPVPIIIGFTNGIAVLIALSQVKDLLGLDIAKMPSDFFAQIQALAQHLGSFNPLALAIGGACLAVVALWPKSYTMPEHPAGLWGKLRRFSAHLPGTIIALAGATLVTALFALPVETIGSRFGDLPAGLPAPSLPAFDWATAQNLFAPTIAIAALGAIESLLCARVADNLINERHDPNQELMAQGIANMVSPIFGGIAATGTIARTVTNVKSGARTPVAGLIHALVLFLIVVALAPLARHVPLAALAAILLWVAFNMGNWREFPKMQEFSIPYRATMLTTFALTVVLDVAVAVQVGLILACLFFIYRMSMLTRVDRMKLPAQLETLGGRRVEAWRVFGTLFFGSVTKIEALADPGAKPPDILILELHQVINIDTTGRDALEQLHGHILRHGGRLVLVAPNEQPLEMLRRGGLLDRIGKANVFATMEDAMEALLDEDDDAGPASETMG